GIRARASRRHENHPCLRAQVFRLRFAVRAHEIATRLIRQEAVVEFVIERKQARHIGCQFFAEAARPGRHGAKRPAAGRLTATTGAGERHAAATTGKNSVRHGPLHRWADEHRGTLDALPAKPAAGQSAAAKAEATGPEARAAGREE